MSDYFLLVIPEYSASANTLSSLPKNAICVCCLAQNVPYITLTTCKHTRLLKTFTDYKKITQSVICHLCHNILKKMEDFRHQVEQSILILKKKTPLLPTKQHNLSITVLENMTLAPDIEETIQKHEPEEIDEHYGAVVDVKAENDIPDMETDMPLLENEEEIWEEAGDDCYNVQKTEEEERDCKPIKREWEDSLMEKKNTGKWGKYFLTSEELEKERESLKVDEAYLKLPFKCDKCIIGFHEELHLQKHNLGRHDKSIGKYICGVCETVCVSKPDLDAHHGRHFIRYKCEPTGNGFIDEMSMVSYHQTSIEEDKYKCIIRGCSYETHSYGSLAYHRLMHRKYPCNMCEKVYIKWSDLKAHMNEVHITAPSVFKCDKCDKKYNMRCRLRVHMQAAHNIHPENEDAPFCVACRKYYRTDAILKLHLKHHPNHVTEADKTYICDACGARYAAKQHLMYHILREHSTKREQCPQCFKLFMNTRNLRRHIDFVHEKKIRPRDIMCDYCGKFTTRQALHDHINTHTGERPYKCTQCSATFAQSSPLYTHKRLVHNPLRDSKRNRRKIK